MPWKMHEDPLFEVNGDAIVLTAARIPGALERRPYSALAGAGGRGKRRTQ